MEGPGTTREEAARGMEPEMAHAGAVRGRGRGGCLAGLLPLRRSRTPQSLARCQRLRPLSQLPQHPEAPERPRTHHEPI